MDDEPVFVFQMMSLDELDEWVNEFVTESEGRDRDAICTMTFAMESMYSFIADSEERMNEYKIFKSQFNPEQELLH